MVPALAHQEKRRPKSKVQSEAIKGWFLSLLDKNLAITKTRAVPVKTPVVIIMLGPRLAARFIREVVAEVEFAMTVES